MIQEYTYIPKGYEFIKPKKFSSVTLKRGNDINIIYGWWKINIASYPYFNDEMKLFVAVICWDESVLYSATTVLPIKNYKHDIQ